MINPGINPIGSISIGVRKEKWKSIIHHDFGRIVKTHLENDQAVWLTSVRKDGTPQPGAVWFVWLDESFVIFTQPGTTEIEEHRQRSACLIALQHRPGGRPCGGLLRRAVIDPTIGPSDRVKEYVAKYGNLHGSSAQSERAINDCNDDPAKFQRLAFFGNKATFGGAIFNDSSSPTIEEVEFQLKYRLFRWGDI